MITDEPGRYERDKTPPHDTSELESKANAWGRVWDRWSDHPMLKEVGSNLANDGCFSAAETLNRFIERLLEDKT